MGHSQKNHQRARAAPATLARHMPPAGLTLAALLCCALALALAAIAADQQPAAKAVDESRALLADIKKYDNCVVQAGFSFLYPASYPPRSMDEFRAACRTQSEAFKCIKDKTRGSSPLLRRGLVTFVGTRQRQHRRFCTNLESEQTKRFVQATSCIAEKRFAAQRANDALLVAKLTEIQRRNYNDSATELKQFCCAVHIYKRQFMEEVGAECASHKHMAEELLNAIMTEDITLVCEDDEKLAKVCPKLESLNVKPEPNFKLAPGKSVPALGLYLIATLGEPASELIDL